MSSNTPSIRDRALASMRDAASVLDQMLRENAHGAHNAHIETIEHVVKMVAAAFDDNKKLLACGNGGSAADAMHFCEELTARFRTDRRALPALACTDAGFLTCAANDFGYDRVFARWVEAFGQRGDVLFVLSTSGNSANVLGAVKAAHERSVHTVAMLGHDGGDLAGVCDAQWIVPGLTADRIQELHMLLLHIVVECVEVQMGLV